MNHSILRGACRLAVGVMIAALVTRTWLVMGLVVPVTVAGSSMAPMLCGPHHTFRCEVCRHEFPVGLDQLPPDDQAACPYCGQRRAVAVTDERGDRLLVDRATLAWRRPRRWEVVVFRCPRAADQLCVKRVVGLPGETVALQGGDVWINGRPARKTLAEQRAVRQLVHRLAADVSCPPASDAAALGSTLSRWQWDAARSPGETQWLVYHHPGGPIADDLSYNQRLSRRLNPVRDVMLSFEARLAGDGQLRLKATGSDNELVAVWDAARQSVQLCRGTEVLAQRSLPRAMLPPRAWAEWTFSLFDRQVLLAIDDRVVVAAPCEAIRRPPAAPEKPAGGPLAIGVRSLRGEIRRLTVWRDVYYASEKAEKVSGTFFSVGRWSVVASTRAKKVPDTFSYRGGWRLGPEAYFVLGDNAAVSDDSRSWLAGPGLDAKLLVGKPLGVR